MIDWEMGLRLKEAAHKTSPERPLSIPITRDQKFLRDKYGVMESKLSEEVEARYLDTVCCYTGLAGHQHDEECNLNLVDHHVRPFLARELALAYQQGYRKGLETAMIKAHDSQATTVQRVPALRSDVLQEAASLTDEVGKGDVL